MDSSEEIDNIIDQLKSDAVPKQISETKTKEIQNLNDENVSEYVYKKTAEVIEAGLQSVNELRDLVVSGQDPREIAALAQLISATTKAIDNLNKINLQAKQHKNNLEVAKVEASGNKLLGTGGPQTNNILIATRDEIMNKFLEGGKGKKEKLDIIDGEFLKE